MYFLVERARGLKRLKNASELIEKYVGDKV
jgi:hypothetical protein